MGSPYQWVVFLHIVAAFVFILAHGGAVASSFALRRERRIERIQALLRVSAGTTRAMYSGLLALTGAGIVAGFMGGWWDEVWIWASLAVLVTITVAMFPLARGPFRRLRAALLDAEDEGEEGSAAVDSALASLPVVLMAVVGFGGTILLLFLMMFKPFCCSQLDVPKELAAAAAAVVAGAPAANGTTPADPAASAPAPAEPSPAPCLALSDDLVHQLSHGLRTATHAGVRGGAAVASPNLPGVFLISADVQLRGWPWIVAVDDAARRLSAFPDATTGRIETAIGSAAVEDSRTCARTRLGIVLASAPGAEPTPAATHVHPPDTGGAHHSGPVEGVDERDRL
jgi:hypothetical protein